jgi:hypothetical protein
LIRRDFSQQRLDLAAQGVVVTRSLQERGPLGFRLLESRMIELLDASPTGAIRHGRASRRRAGAHLSMRP